MSANAMKDDVQVSRWSQSQLTKVPLANFGLLFGKLVILMSRILLTLPCSMSVLDF